MGNNITTYFVCLPPYRKGESRIFDTSQQLTPASLMSFLVTTLTPSHRLALAVSLCGDQCKEQVFQMARLATTQLHHSLSSSTTRLLLVLDKLAGLTQDSSVKSLDKMDSHLAHYQTLFHMKKLLAKDIKRQRIKLSYLIEIQKFLSGVRQPDDQDSHHYSDLLKTLSSLMQMKGVSSNLSKDSANLSKQQPFHDEL